MTRISIHGKCILVGEHAVVYGCPAIAIPVPELRLELEMFRSLNGQLKMAVDGKDASNLIRKLVFESHKNLGIEFKGAEIMGSSNIPIGAGFGSSAAFCAGMTRLIATAHDKHLSQNELLEIANELEKRFHGTPSGIDTTVIVLNKPIYFENSTNITTIEPKKSFQFLLVDSGIRSPTVAMVQKAKDVLQGPNHRQVLGDFTFETNQCRDALASGDYQKLATSIRQTHELLDHIGVVSPPLHKMIQTSQEMGCLAAKISGAGGGGAILALLPEDPNVSQSVVQKMKDHYREQLVIPLNL